MQKRPEQQFEDRYGRFDERFPGQRDVVGTHWDDCYKQHPACAYLLAVSDVENASAQAVGRMLNA